MNVIKCEVLDPSYEVSPIKERNLIYNVSEDVKEDSELYDWILNYDELQDLKNKRHERWNKTTASGSGHNDFR